MHPNRTSTIVGLGELLWDLFPDGRRPGGAPANVAFHAHQFGFDGVVCSKLGNDEPGDALRAELARVGLRTELLQSDPSLPTGTVTVDTSNAERPEYTIHEPVAWDALEPSAEMMRLAGSCAAVCFGTLAQRTERTRETIRGFLDEANKALRVFDVNLRQDWYTPEVIEQSLRRADVIKLNSDELDELSGMFELGQDDPIARSRSLLRRSTASLVCITRAENGCLLVTESDAHDEPGSPVTVVDAVGAGDAFTAAMIVARLGCRSLASTARLAGSAGALVAASPGSMPDLRRHYESLLNEG